MSRIFFFEKFWTLVAPFSTRRCFSVTFRLGGFRIKNSGAEARQRHKKSQQVSTSRIECFHFALELCCGDSFSFREPTRNPQLITHFPRLFVIVPPSAFNSLDHLKRLCFLRLHGQVVNWSRKEAGTDYNAESQKILQTGFSFLNWTEPPYGKFSFSRFILIWLPKPRSFLFENPKEIFHFSASITAMRRFPNIFTVVWKKSSRTSNCWPSKRYFPSSLS